MFNIIFSPLKEIEAEKKKRSMGKTFIKLVVGSLLLGIATLILALNLGMGFNVGIQWLIGLTVLAFLGALFNSWVYLLVIRTISGKGKYYDTLTSATNALLIMSAGLVISVLLWMIPAVGLLLAAVFMIMMAAIAYAVQIKSLMVLTGTDLLTVIVSLAVAFVASIVALLLLNTMTSLTQLATAPAGGLVPPTGL